MPRASFVLLPAVLLALVPLVPAADAQAQPRHARHTAAAHPAAPATSADGPKSVGKFDDWQAATHQEAGQTVCYAFTRAAASAPSLPGRGDVVLTVTQRPGSRDNVAIAAGFAFPANADVAMQVEAASLPFYTSQRSAFARDGHAVVAAFEKGRQAVAKSSGPKNTQVTDTFSLRGFNAAYAATAKACPK